MKIQISTISRESAVNYFLNFFANDLKTLNLIILAKNLSENEVVQLKKIKTETNNESDQNSSVEIAEKYGKRISDESFNDEKKYSIFIKKFLFIFY